MSVRICKIEGCTRPVGGRGMCRLHYNRWSRANPGVTTMAINRQALLDAMPGTIPELIERTGLSLPTVNRQLAILNDRKNGRLAYIIDWKAPTGRGTKWYAIYAEGDEANKRLTDERKAENARDLRKIGDQRRAWAARSGAKASWLAALQVAL